MKNELATIESITRIYPHPNADTLELCEVRNCQVVVPKDKYKAGDIIAFIWPDSILPDKEWAAFYKAKSSRVRAIKLRQEFSFGIVEALDHIGYAGEVEVGKDIADEIGVTKYEPPAPKDLQAKGYLPFGIPKTDEENHYKLNSLPFGQKCTVTRKRDGSSGSFYYDLSSDTFGALSRSLELKTECLNSWTEHISQYNIESKLRDYCQKHQVSLCVRGESFGNGRNGHKANVDAKQPTTWEVFSVWDIDKRRYILLNEDHNFIDLANECDFKHVPILEAEVELTPELIKQYSDSDIGFEGVVIHCNGETFKIINKAYDSKK